MKKCKNCGEPCYRMDHSTSDKEFQPVVSDDTVTVFYRCVSCKEIQSRTYAIDKKDD